MPGAPGDDAKYNVPLYIFHGDGNDMRDHVFDLSVEARWSVRTLKEEIAARQPPPMYTHFAYKAPSNKNTLHIKHQIKRTLCI